MATKTIRGKRIWVRITKPAKGKYFEFHTGYNGSTQSFKNQTWPQTVLPLWKDAITLAESQVANY